MFNIDFIQLVTQLLAYFLRMPKMLSWLSASMKGLTNLYNDYVTYSTETLYELGITYQVVYLEKLLNDNFNGAMAAYTFDPTTSLYSPQAGAIYITDGPVIQPVYIWNKAEGRPPVYVYNLAEAQPPLYMHNQAEFDGQISFIIMIPTGLINIMTQPQQVAEIKRLVDKFKMAGQLYILQNY